MTKSDPTKKAFATLRFTGDALDPDEISSALGTSPTRAYRKGQIFSPGPRTPRVVGRTGIWYLSTDKLVSSGDLGEHLRYLVEVLAPDSPREKRLARIRELMQRDHLEAHVTCFWFGEEGEPEPTIPPEMAATFARLPADIETDFSTG